MTAPAEAKTVTPIKKIDPARFSPAEFRRNHHVLNLSVDQDYADLFKPEAWKLIAQKGAVGLGDKIEVRRDDMTLYAELWVVEAVTHHAHIRLVELSKKEFEPAKQDETNDDQFEIKHLGLNDGWAVLNKSTQRVIQKGLKSKEHAKSYINTDLRPQLVGRS